MRNIVIFGGTTEGRELVERLMVDEKLNIYVCVATSYGAGLLPEQKNVHVETGRMDQQEMEHFLLEKKAGYCVDATHPYAVVVTQNICRACASVGVTYLRVLREETAFSGQKPAELTGKTADGEMCGDMIYRDSVEEAVDYLTQTEGIIFVSTGSKELEKYTRIPGYQKRLVARVLPTEEVLRMCKELELSEEQIIALQGPFSQEQNYEMFTRSKARWLVTKSSGRAGGYEEKCEAALRAGMKIVVIGRPQEPVTEHYTIERVQELVRG